MKTFNKESIDSCLSLFFAVPQCTQESKNKEPELIYEYGIVIPSKASLYRDVIYKWLSDNHSTAIQLNFSFYKSWKKLQESTKEELVREQILHYFSTYGLQSVGLYHKDYIYIPNELLKVPNWNEEFKFRVLKIIPVEDLKERCLDLLITGVALKQQTIEHVLNVLSACGYVFSGNEDIKNKEARILIVDKIGVLPEDGEDLFRYIFYKATGGKTLVINDKASREAIKEVKYELPMFTDTQKLKLAESYLRESREALWMCIKQANQVNKSVVNRIAKLAWKKKKYKPLPVNVLNFLTSKEFTVSQVIEAAHKANTFKLISAVNALRFYQLESNSRMYRIRNGKSYSQEKDTSLSPITLQVYESLLMKELKSRMKEHKVFYPCNVDYALPTSEKAFVDKIPMNTIFTLPPTEESFLIGAYWEGDMVDLDLRGDSIAESIGWNTSIRSKDTGLMLSGDITSAPNGATEWLYCKDIGSVYAIKLSIYTHSIEQYSYRLIMGYGSNVKSEYICDPNKVIFEFNMMAETRETTLGFLEQVSDRSIKFILGGLGSGNSSVGRYTKHGGINIDANLNMARSSLRLKDLIPSEQELSEGVVDLSPNNLQKDTILKLFM